MIPDTAAALLALLGLVAPGLVYQLRRERRRPSPRQTVLREASRIALTSLIFTVTALILLRVVSEWWDALPDLRAWIGDPRSYVAANVDKIAAFLTLEVVLACAIAVAAERITAGSLDETIVEDDVWFTVLRRDVPADAARLWLWVTTDDGTQFKGPLRAYSAGAAAADRELVLGGQPMRRLGPTKNPDTDWETLDAYDAVILPASDIRHLAVQYLTSDGETRYAERPARR